MIRVERCFQDAKTSVGMADYQARGWIAWHHHMALVMLAMLFVVRERKLHEREIELLSYQDIIELLNVYETAALTCCAHSQ
jgi:SRSO17 transposase